jgi:hypothetical protein
LHTVVAAYAGDANFHGTTNSLAPDQLINAPPVATDDVLSARENTSVSAAAFKLLLNDSDPDADPLSVTAVSGSSAQGGTVLLASGTLTYSPPASYSGADSFTYTLADSFGETASGTVNVTIYSATNQPERVVSLESLAGGSKRLTFAGIPGYSYIVQASTNMANWMPVSTNNAGTNGLFIFVDGAAADYPSRYYRSVSH